MMVMKNTEDYIKEQMLFYAQNIDDFSIGQSVIDEDDSICEISNKSRNTIEVFMKKKSKDGVNCKQWFDMKSFNRKFKKLKQ